MAASRSDIERWLETGKKLGASHMIVVCDTFDWEDYPVYVYPDQNVRQKSKECDDPSTMRNVMEVYSFSHDIEAQLNATQVFNFN